MSIALDGFEVLRQVGKHRDIFASVRTEVDKQARALVVKCLKAKSVDLPALRDICRALGHEPFGLLLDGLKDAEIKSLLTRLDKHYPNLKTASAASRRQHLGSLADGSSDAHAPPAKVKKAKKAKAEPSRLRSESMDVFRAGGRKGR